MNLALGAGLFVLAILTDIVWAKYTKAVSDNQALRASVFAVGIVVLGMVYIAAYIHSLWYVVPIAVGSAVGTFGAVTHSKRRSP